MSEWTPALDAQRRTLPASRAGVLDVARAADPMAAAIAGIGTLLVHSAALALAVLAGGATAREHAGAASVTELFDVELATPEPAPPPPHSEEEPAAPSAPRPPRHEPRLTPRPSSPQEPPPPAPAQAAQVLAADAPVDFGDTIVVGKGETYAGGVTASEGSSRRAVHDSAARSAGAIGGTGDDVTADRSRAPRLAGGAQWDCPFPSEADDEGLDHALVALRIEVAADGRVLKVEVERDPGSGFAREARLCALRKRWAPGLDRAGRAAQSVATLNVRFDR